MAQAAAGAARALCTSFAATAAPQPAARCLQPHPLAGRHPAGYAWLARQRLSTTCSASSGGGGAGAGAGSPPPRGRGRPSSSPGSSRGASSAVGSSDDLQRLKGVGPANEKKLQDGGILNVQDLQQVYREKCDKDVQQLAEYLQVGTVAPRCVAEGGRGTSPCLWLPARLARQRRAPPGWLPSRRTCRTSHPARCARCARRAWESAACTAS